MATRPQQLVICQGIQDKCGRITRLALKYQANTVDLEEGNDDTEVTLSAQQKADLVARFDALVASVKADAATL